MKKYYSLALAALCTLSFALTGCEKKNEPAAPIDNTVDNSNAPVFTATIEGDDAAANAAANGPRKTQLVNGTQVHWESGDEVIIYGSGMATSYVMFAKYAATPDAEDPTIATLTCQKMMRNNGSFLAYKAYYPASMVKISTLTDDEINNIGNSDLTNGQYRCFILPATQKYNGTNICAPMYGCKEESGPVQQDPVGPMEPGSSADLSTYELTFYNTAAILAITVPSAQMTAVSSITLTADKKIHGECDVEEDKSLRVASSTTDAAYKVVTLDCTDAEGQATAIPADGSKTFYIVVPVRNSSDPYTSFKFEVTDGTVTKTMTTKDGFSSALARNTIYEIAFADNQTVAPANALTFTFPNATCWSQDNNIWVNGVEYVYHSGKGTTTGVYVPENEETVATPNEDGKYCAIYPYSAAYSGVIFLAEGASYGRYDCPMYAESSTTSGFQFGGFGMLAVSFTGYSESIDVSISADNGEEFIRLFGTFYPKNGFYQDAAYAEQSEEFKSWNASNTLYVPIPSGSYNEISVSAYGGEYEEEYYEGGLSITDITTVSSGQLYERTLTLVEQIIDEGDY